jgi:hypothetical protein
MSLTRNRDAVVMPPQLTPAMRKAAEAVRPPLTIAETPYFDRLWNAWLEAAREEQGVPTNRDLAKHVYETATEGLNKRG